MFGHAHSLISGWKSVEQLPQLTLPACEKLELVANSRMVVPKSGLKRLRCVLRLDLIGAARVEVRSGDRDDPLGDGAILQEACVGSDRYRPFTDVVEK